MLHIEFREYNNGFGVSGFSDEEGCYIFDEIAETKLDALEVLRNWLVEEYELERRKLSCN